MTNNNTHKENDMFNKLTSEDLITDADNYNAALEMIEAQHEIEMIEADEYAEMDEYIDEMYDELELDIEVGVPLEDDEDDEYAVDFDTDDFNSVDEFNNQLDALCHVDQSYEYDEMQSQYDDDRDVDFYGS